MDQLLQENVKNDDDNLNPQKDVAKNQTMECTHMMLVKTLVTHARKNLTSV